VQRDAITHPWFAAQGYAAVRLDIRGTGDSDGLMLDEYLQQEQDDAVEAIEWLAKQKWCNGRVGMMGISWGGFNGLQIAARRPPALKAIITLCSTDDRFADDAHWMGGAVINNTMGWGSSFFQYLSQPPDPAIVGEKWRAMWLDRLENLQLPIAEWLRHQHYDEYWRHGSVREDYGAIQAAVYAMGGWADGYSNAVPRMMKNLKCPKKGLIGPWAHKYPHIATPKPAMDFLGEALRWWDHWLKDKDTGIMKEPEMQVWLQDSVRPSAVQPERPGRWVAFPQWPHEAVQPRVWHLGADGLSDGTQPDLTRVIDSPLETGITFSEWCAYSGSGELPGDQRTDDGRSVVFETEPLSEPVAIVGAPLFDLNVTLDDETALLAGRLQDVHPDGASQRELRPAQRVAAQRQRRSQAVSGQGDRDGAIDAERYCACISGRPSHPHRDFHQLLAAGLAGAAARGGRPAYREVATDAAGPGQRREAAGAAILRPRSRSRSPRGGGQDRGCKSADHHGESGHARVRRDRGSRQKRIPRSGHRHGPHA
jgi:hypothetical protein